MGVRGRFQALEMWRALPGPWWCKVLLLAAVLAIPGQVDEIVLFALLAALRKRRARISAAQITAAQLAAAQMCAGGAEA